MKVKFFRVLIWVFIYIVGTPLMVWAQPHCKVTMFVEPDFCTQGNLILHASPWNFTPPIMYLWSNGETTQDIIVPPNSGVYTITITDALGCTANWTVDLGAFNFTYFIEQYGGCPNEGTQLTINWNQLTNPGNYIYQWSNGEMTSVATITPPGVFNVTITDPDTGCSTVLSINAIAYPEPIPDIVGTSALCSGNSGTLTVTGGPFSSIYW
ncbi:MAG: hypothetical protein MUE72_13995, partial [Chitinophagaceae bacterium]|nr:hypothetical protein [Chitinophagaceae bacterium]